MVRPIAVALFSSFALCSIGQAQPQGDLQDLQRLMRLLEQRVVTAEKWATVHGKYVVLNYVPGNAYGTASIQPFLASCDHAVEQDCSTFALDLPSRPVPIYLFPTSEDMGRALHVPVAGAFSAGYWLALPDGPNGATADLPGTATGELGQILVRDQLGQYQTAVFNQGLGLYLKARATGEVWIKRPKPTLETPLIILAEQATKPEEYKEGAEFVAYLMSSDSDNPTRLKQLLTALSEQKLADLRDPRKVPWPDRVNGAFKQVYGSDLQQLELKWRTSTK